MRQLSEPVAMVEDAPMEERVYEEPEMEMSEAAPMEERGYAMETEMPMEIRNAMMEAAPIETPREVLNERDVNDGPMQATPRNVFGR